MPAHDGLLTPLRSLGAGHRISAEPRPGFIRGLDATAAIRSLRLAQVHEAAVRVGDRELAAALASMLERTSAAGLTAEPPAETFRTANARLLVTAVRTGHSDPDAIGRGDVGSALSGLLRTLDLRARRHSYTTSGSRDGGLTAELGALITPGCGGQIPVWTLVDGRIVTDRYLPMTSTAGHWARARFCAPPLRSGEHSLMRRVRLTLRRIFDAVLLRPPPPACIPESSGPVGYLFEEPAEARLALWSGVHPVVGDQLLTWSPEAIARAGYEDASLLGYLVAKAPHTGRLGPLSAPLVPWVGAGESVDDGA